MTLLEIQENQEYLNHFNEELSLDIKKYATDNVFINSRYIFYNRQGREQFGYCTHCKTDFKATSTLKHNTHSECPNCKSKCLSKSNGMGRYQLIDEAYFVYYEKSIIDSKILVARGLFAKRDYRGDYRKVETKYIAKALYIFEMGNSVMLVRNWSSFNKCKTVYSLYNQYNSYRTNVIADCADESIVTAVKDTQFQYSTYENYYYEDMVRFFDLYAKYPCIEYLTKVNMMEIVKAKLVGRNTYGSINWRGKSLLKVVRLSKQDFKELNTSKKEVDPLFLRILQIAKKDGSKLNFEEITKFEKTYGSYYHYLQKCFKYTSVRKIINYVGKHCTADLKTDNYYGKQNFITMWKDYICECEELMMDLSDGRILFPKNLLEAHQETSQRIKSDGNLLMDTKIKGRLPSLANYCFEYNGLMIRPAESTTELIIEGKELNICVGTYCNGYMTRYSKGQTNILLIRKIEDANKPFYTMELNKNQIMQVQGVKHCSPDQAVKVFIEAFKAEKLSNKKELAIAI